jgi:dihydroflavonol-4-reductase
MRTLVLGGSGFVGGWITQALANRGHNVVVIGHSRGDADARAEFVKGDFGSAPLLRDALHDCVGLIYAGAYYPLYSLHRDDQVEHARSELRTVIDAARASRIISMVFISTLSVMNRDPAAVKHSTYHAIKRALHDDVLRAIDDGLPASIAVPGACFGPGDRKPTTGRVIVEICNGRLPFVLEGKMNAVDVRDVAAAVAIMLERAQPGSVYQLGNWNCSYTEFAQHVAACAGITAHRYHMPYAPARFASIIVELAQHAAHAHVPLLPQSGLDLIHYGAHLDSTAARHDLEFSPRSIDRTIIETIAWFRENGYLNGG